MVQVAGDAPVVTDGAAGATPQPSSAETPADSNAPAWLLCVQAARAKKASSKGKGERRGQERARSQTRKRRRKASVTTTSREEKKKNNKLKTSAPEEQAASPPPPAS